MTEEEILEEEAQNIVEQSERLRKEIISIL